MSPADVPAAGQSGTGEGAGGKARRRLQPARGVLPGMALVSPSTTSRSLPGRAGSPASSGPTTSGSASLTRDPGNDVKLRLYALYKQAAVGDVRGRRPGFTDLVGRAKYDAWAKVEGMSSQDAKQAYVELVAELSSETGGPAFAGRRSPPP